MTRVVLTDARDGIASGFLEIRDEVYTSSAQEIPEDKTAVSSAFSSDNPWLASGEAATIWTAGKARVAVFAPNSFAIEGKRACFFGYFESTERSDDPEGTRAVLSRAEAWARDKGAEWIFGPINFSTYGNYRIRLSAEPDAITFPGEPYNPDYYQDLLEVCGYQLHHNYLTQISTTGQLTPARSARKASSAAIKSGGFTIKPLTHEKWLRSHGRFQALIDRIYERNFAYTPLSKSMFRQMCGRSYIQKADPTVSVMCLAPDGEIVGFFLVYPHYGPLVIRGAGENRVPVDSLKFETHWPQLKALGHRVAVAKSVGVDPAYRDKGVMGAMALALIDQGEGRYERWFGALIRADNPSRRFGDTIETQIRTYGLYSKQLF